MKNEKKVRAVFIYLAIISVILGIIGILIINKDISGRASLEKEVKIGDFYSREEVAGHNNEQDCWVSSNGKVYDITFLMPIEESLRDKCGKDISLSLDEQYKIGILK